MSLLVSVFKDPRVEVTNGISEYYVKSSKGDIEYCVYKSWRKGWMCECRHFSLFRTDCRHIKVVKWNL